MTPSENETPMTDDQLNKEMAEKMGWEHTRQGGPLTFDSPVWIRPGYALIHQMNCPNYCGGWNLMREVMESLGSKGWAVDLYYSPSDDDSYVTIERLEPPMTQDETDALCRIVHHAAELPRALCELIHEASEKGWL